VRKCSQKLKEIVELSQLFAREYRFFSFLSLALWGGGGAF
jgi:hypothetical protein